MNIFASNAAETKGVGPELNITRTELNAAFNLTLELNLLFSLVIVDVSIVSSDQLMCNDVGEW